VISALLQHFESFPKPARSKKLSGTPQVLLVEREAVVAENKKAALPPSTVAHVFENTSLFQCTQ
jgi:hypothetical protein